MEGEREGEWERERERKRGKEMGGREIRRQGGKGKGRERGRGREGRKARGRGRKREREREIHSLLTVEDVKYFSMIGSKGRILHIKNTRLFREIIAGEKNKEYNHV